MYFGSLGTYSARRPFGNHPTLGNELMAYWRLEEISGTRRYLLGDQDLTDNGGVGFQTTGKSGHCASFGSTSYLSHGWNPAVQPGLTGQGGTYSMWFRRSAPPVGALASLGGEGVGSNPAWGIRAITTGPAGRIGSYMRDADGTLLSANSTTDFCNDVWNQAVWTYTPADFKLRLYVNGALQDTSTSSGTHVNIKDSQVGNFYAYETGVSAIYWNHDSAARAFIDEIILWNRPLNLSEVSDLYNSGNGRFY